MLQMPIILHTHPHIHIYIYLHRCLTSVNEHTFPETLKELIDKNTALDETLAIKLFGGLIVSLQTEV